MDGRATSSSCISPFCKARHFNINKTIQTHKHERHPVNPVRNKGNTCNMAEVLRLWKHLAFISGAPRTMKAPFTKFPECIP